jgi:uncharacterized repeat protein (TIGR03833 family)
MAESVLVDMASTTRSNIKPGIRTLVIQKQRTGKTTEGVVQDIVANAPTHPDEIKVGWRAALWAG